MCDVTAKATLHGHDLSNIPVINPAGWFGKTWLIEIGGCYTPLFLIVEADSVQDAIDELADNEQWGHHIIVPERGSLRLPGRGSALWSQWAGSRS